MNKTNKFVVSLAVGLSMLLGAAAAGSWLTASHSPVWAQDAHPELPPGPGRDLVITTCTKCHGTMNFTSQRRSSDEWTATITKMVGYGATGTDEDFESILDYLTKNFGPDSPAPGAAAAPAPAPTGTASAPVPAATVPAPSPAGTAPAAAPTATVPAATTSKIDVNKETAAQLKTDLGLTEDEAEAIVHYRDKNGSFKSMDDLKKVPNVDAKKLDAKKDSLLFS